MTRPTVPIGLLLLVASCGDGAVEIPIPNPTLTGLEPPVQAKLAQCRQGVLNSPTVNSWSLYGRTLQAHGLFADAENAHAAAAQLADDPFDHCYLAGASANELDADRALSWFEKARDLKPEHVLTRINLALLHEQAERFDDAREHYRFVIGAEPISHAHLGLGRIELATGTPAAALKHFEAAVALRPDHREVHEAMARTYGRLGEAAKSRAAAQKAGDLAWGTNYPDPLMAQVERENVSSNARMSRGIDHARNGRFSAAETELRASLRVRPENLVTRFFLARVLMDQKRPEDALAEADRILEIDSRHAGALEVRARLLSAGKDGAAARRAVNALLAVDPDNVWGLEQKK